MSSLYFLLSTPSFLYWSEREEISLQIVLLGFTTVLSWAVSFVCFLIAYCYHFLLVTKPSLLVTYELVQMGLPGSQVGMNHWKSLPARTLITALLLLFGEHFSPSHILPIGMRGGWEEVTFVFSLRDVRSRFQWSSSKCPVNFPCQEALWSPCKWLLGVCPHAFQASLTFQFVWNISPF